MKNTTRKIECSSQRAMQRQQGQARVGMAACVPQGPDDMSRPGSELQASHEPRSLLTQTVAQVTAADAEAGWVPE